MGRWLVVVGALVGCLDPGLVPCGENVCARGSTCIDGMVCATHEQIAACEGISDGSVCTVAGTVGRCERGVCVDVGCGNGEVDPEEACDDGNATSGDGCRSDCRKAEICGDAVVDIQERCDDGNDNPADGCDACVSTIWNATAVIGSDADPLHTRLSLPTGIAVDRIGNLYVADQYNNRIRRVDPSGVIVTFAGTGIGGFSGDGGPATSAQLSRPFGVAVDGLGNVFISDTSNGRIRRVDTNGIITTIGGGPQQTFPLGDGGPATSAWLNSPEGIAIDGAGNLYIADSFNMRIRRIDTNGVISTVAGTTQGFSGDGGPATSAQLYRPAAVAVDGAGNLFIGDSWNSRVRKVDATGRISTLGSLGRPYGVAVDETGVYVGDPDNGRVAKIDSGGAITTYASGFVAPFGVARWQDKLFLVDNDAALVERVDPGGAIAVVAGTDQPIGNGDGGPATSVPLVWSLGVTADATGNVYIAERSGNRIRKVTPAGVVTTLAGDGTAIALAAPRDIILDGAGNLIFTEESGQRVRMLDAAGTLTTIAGTGISGFSGDNAPATNAQINTPGGLAIDAAGAIYFADTNNQRIRRIANGIITTVAGNGTKGFAGDTLQAINAQLASPTDVAVAANGTLYIADGENFKIRKVDPTGVITTFAGTTSGYAGDGAAANAAKMTGPNGIVLDGSGNLLIADTANSRIRKVTIATGIITTFAGSGTFGFGGDGGPANLAQLELAGNIGVDPSGNVYICESFPTRGKIRRVNSNGMIVTIAGKIDLDGMGPVPTAHLADPRALVVTPDVTFVAGGSSGTIQAMRVTEQIVEVVAGRYPQTIANNMLARFRDASFGTVEGVAFDGVDHLYVSETSANRIHVVTLVGPDWTIAPLDVGGVVLSQPAGLFLDGTKLLVAESGAHVIRAIDLVTHTSTIIAGTASTRGFFGDGGDATAALLHAPRAVTRCANGDLFIADTSNNRIRRVVADGTISTVLGDGVAASSGEGRPAVSFPVREPLGVGCDAIGNLFATSSTTVRFVAANDAGVVDGSGAVHTIYGSTPRVTFPANVTSCLSGLAITGVATIKVVDSCSGILVELRRELAP